MTTVSLDQEIEKSAESPEYSYELTPEQMSELTERLLAERPPVPGERFVCYRLDGDDAYANIARTIECQVFKETFDEGPEDMQEGYGAYESQSRFYLSVDTENKTSTGMLRVIRNGPNGLKTLNDVAEENNDPEYIQKVYDHYNITNPDECLDVGTVAVPRAHKGGSLLLFRGMYVDSQQEGIKHFFSVIDEKPYEMMQFMGFPFKQLVGTKWGSYAKSKNSIRVYGDAPTFEDAVREQESRLDEETRKLAQSAFALLGHGSRDGALQFLNHND